MPKNYSFPSPACRNCEFYKDVGPITGETRYCGGFKRRKPKRFLKSDPRIKPPKWCPRRLSPQICRVYGFKDSFCEYRDMLSRLAYANGEYKTVVPLESHYKLKAEIPLGKSAKDFFKDVQEHPLREIVPDIELQPGEIIEIDDGLRPYYFYNYDEYTIIPLPFFRIQNQIKSEEGDS